ncbi:MAG: ABC transporter permease [Clostridiales bacterium]|nr:ABC transporter permease [Clostridiales bacterium]
MEKRGIFNTKTFGLVIITIALTIVIYLISPSFLAKGNVRNLLNTLSFQGVMLAGITILLLSGNFDMSAGGVGALSMLIFGLFVQTMKLPLGVALIAGLLTGVICGLINVVLINVFNLQPFIATIATSSIFGGIGNVATRGNSIAINAPAFTDIGKIALFKLIPFFFILMVIIVLAHTFVLYRTRFGRSIYMIGGNMFAARLCGLDIKRTRTYLYISQGLMSAISGLIWCCLRKQANPGGFTVAAPNMQAMIAALLGGISFMGGAGGIGGAAIGLVLLNIFTTGLLMIKAPTFITTMMPGILLIIALLMDNINAMRMRRILMAAAIKQGAVAKKVS